MKLIFTVALLTLSISAFSNCENPENQREINQCAAKRAEVALKMVDKQTKLAIVALKPKAADNDHDKVIKARLLSALTSSAKNFKGLIFGECVLTADSIGGSMESAEVNGCIEEKAKMRRSLIEEAVKKIQF